MAARAVKHVAASGLSAEEFMSVAFDANRYRAMLADFEERSAGSFATVH